MFTLQNLLCTVVVFGKKCAFSQLRVAHAFITPETRYRNTLQYMFCHH